MGKARACFIKESPSRTTEIQPGYQDVAMQEAVAVKPSNLGGREETGYIKC